MSARLKDAPEAVVILGDESWCDGAGWYYYDAEYRDEGVCGAFATRQEATDHASEAGYVVTYAGIEGAS